jgi:hypothetical protein
VKLFIQEAAERDILSEIVRYAEILDSASRKLKFPVGLEESRR